MMRSDRIRFALMSHLKNKLLFFLEHFTMRDFKVLNSIPQLYFSLCALLSQPVMSHKTQSSWEWQAACSALYFNIVCHVFQTHWEASVQSVLKGLLCLAWIKTSFLFLLFTVHWMVLLSEW